jgi:hypothetical protein
VVYNSAIATVDFTLLAYSGWSLLNYIETYFPNLDTKKVQVTQIKQSIWASAAFYLGRSSLLISLMIVEIEVSSFNYDDSTDYYVFLKLIYYLLTDLVFLVLLNLIVNAQETHGTEVQKSSAHTLSGVCSTVLHTFSTD